MVACLQETQQKLMAENKTMDMLIAKESLATKNKLLFGLIRQSPKRSSAPATTTLKCYPGVRCKTFSMDRTKSQQIDSFFTQKIQKEVTNCAEVKLYILFKMG